MLLKKAKAYLAFEAPLPVTAERKRMQVRLEHMIALLQEAMGNGVPEKLAEVIRELSERSDDIEKAVVVWVQLIEVLVQHAERGRPQPGQGQLKKDEVKGALRHILNSSRFEIPNVPHYLQPVIIDFAIDWAIDAIVQETNRYQLWTFEPPEPTTAYSILCGAVVRFLVWTRPALEWIAEQVARVYVALRYYRPLPPELRAAVDAVEAQGLFIDKRDFMKAGTEAVIFIGEHGPQVIALFRLAFEAVREAERFVDLSGPEKKQYAQDVILTVLSELGFPVDSGLIGAIIRSFADGAIESAVDIFNRRAPEMFQHRQIA